MRKVLENTAAIYLDGLVKGGGEEVNNLLQRIEDWRIVKGAAQDILTRGASSSGGEKASSSTKLE